MAKGKYDKYLKNAQKAFDEAQASNSFINPNIEDGKDQECKLVKAELVEIGKDAKLYVAWTYEFEVDKKLVKKNPAAGHIRELNGLEEERISFLKKRLDFFGYDVGDINLAQDLPQILKELTKKQPGVIATVKTVGDYQNVYCNQLLDADDADDDDDDDADDDDKADDDDADDDEEEADDDDDAPEMEKGDKVLWKAPRARKASEHEIIKIKNGKADLKDEAGGVHKGILLEKLEKVEDEDADDDSDDDSDDDAGEEESDFAEVTKGSNLEVKDGKKTYKAVAVADPNDKNETIKVKFTSGPKKGKTETVDQSDCELLD